jgi:hypothetical protein
LGTFMCNNIRPKGKKRFNYAARLSSEDLVYM